MKTRLKSPVFHEYDAAVIYHTQEKQFPLTKTVAVRWVSFAGAKQEKITL